jgi:hypothetical protein
VKPPLLYVVFIRFSFKSAVHGLLFIVGMPGFCARLGRRISMIVRQQRKARYATGTLAVLTVKISLTVGQIVHLL